MIPRERRISKVIRFEMEVKFATLEGLARWFQGRLNLPVRLPHFASQVAIHSGGVKDQATTINTGDEVTWINAAGSHVIHLDFESSPETHPYHMLFTTSTTLTLQFSRPGTYPYTVYVGSQALAHRGKIVVK